MNDKFTPNRFGDPAMPAGCAVCCHEVQLWKICEFCNKLLDRFADPSDSFDTQPNLHGTGHVIDFDFKDKGEENE